MARRGRPRRSEDADEYITWREAEAKVALQAEPRAGTVDDVAAEMFVEPVTVTRWRRTVADIGTFRAWLHETYYRFDGMADLVERGDFDSMAATLPKPPPDDSAYLADIIPKLAQIPNMTTSRLARLLGVSRRTVGRYRTD